MASEKLAALPRSADEIVLCADTTVALGRRILGWPYQGGATVSSPPLRLRQGTKFGCAT
jgi:predicted house-cleaning NTP pyrophosphatase (Maf/HAM1 superfamily)